MSEEATCTICGQPVGENGRCQHCDEVTHIWTIRDWRPVLTLSLIIVLGFSFTRLVVSGFDDRQHALAAEYKAAGVQAMDAKRPADAVDAFETALVYSRDNFQYRLQLTDALLASGAWSEAQAQLHAFWEQRPGDSQVNLKLARLEAEKKHVDEAVRYYENAIEGVWPERTDPIPLRVGVRLEEAAYLVDAARREQAEAALLALAAVLPANSPEQGKLGALYLRNGDAVRALAVYQARLRFNRDDEEALLGAGKASFAAGSYAMARRYMEELKLGTEDAQRLRGELDRMEALDPFSRNASGRVRTERTMAAFQIALGRLARCGAPFAQTMANDGKTGHAAYPAQTQWSGLAKWAEQLAPMMTERKLRGRDEVIESTMRFVFQAEAAAQKDCGNPTLDDEALLLLGRERMGANR